MKIAYLLYWNDFGASGVWQKVLVQCRHWVSSGHTVEVFLATKSVHTPEERVLGLRYNIERFRGHFGRLKAFRRLARSISLQAHDIVYHRYETPELAILPLSKRVPIVLEINSDDRAEARFQSARHQLYRAIVRKSILRAAKGAVFVTHELAARPAFEAVRGGRVVVSNGIDRDRVRSVAVSNSWPPRAVFVGSGLLPWHGVEDVIELAQRLPHVDFDIVGYEAAQCHGVLPTNVRCHGVLGYEKYVHLLEASTVGIGTLALHRNGMTEACPLKVREYLAHGIPVIIGYKDTDIAESDEFALMVPNRPGGIVSDIERVRLFINSWRGRRVSEERVACMDARVKEAARLQFFRQCI